MEKLLTEDTVNGVTEQFYLNDNTVVVRRSEDVTHVIDTVAKANAAGGTREFAGMRLAAEIPVTVAIEYAKARGLPSWEALLYGPHEDYRKELLKLIKENPRLAYDYKGKRVSL